MRVFGYVRVGLGMRVFNSGDSMNEKLMEFMMRDEDPSPFPFQVMIGLRS